MRAEVRAAPRVARIVRRRVGEDDVIHPDVAPRPGFAIHDLQPGLLAFVLGHVQTRRHIRLLLLPVDRGHHLRRSTSNSTQVRPRARPPPISKVMNRRTIVNGLLVSVPVCPSFSCTFVAGGRSVRVDHVLTLAADVALVVGESASILTGPFPKAVPVDRPALVSLLLEVLEQDVLRGAPSRSAAAAWPNIPRASESVLAHDAIAPLPVRTGPLCQGRPGFARKPKTSTSSSASLVLVTV